MILIIDNYDSFVFNLARYIEQLGYQTRIIRNDKISITEIATHMPAAIVLSPGPCTPNEAGICLNIVCQLGSKIPILGVCLGHQVIGQAFGATITRAIKPMHGKASLIHHHCSGLFTGLPNPLNVGRYHSLIVSNVNFPRHALEISAVSEEGEIMAICHHNFPIYGAQFHPESILTELGYEMLKNFLSIIELPAQTTIGCAQAMPKA